MKTKQLCNIGTTVLCLHRSTTTIMAASSVSCTALAEALNANYLSNTTFDAASNSSLPEYLNSTGVLLSVCLDGNCTDDEFHEVDVHLSGSWIQDGTTGPRIFEMGEIGMILDPTKVDILCLYPLDGLSDGRSRQGCGPINDYLPNWLDRQRLRMALYMRKILKGFWRTKWEEIPCCKFLSEDASDKKLCNDVAGMIDRNATWTTMIYWQALLMGDILGHVICYDDTFPDFDMMSEERMLPYIGSEPWMPLEWEGNTKVTQDIIREHPKMRIWNEVVMKNIADLEGYNEIVQAVFFIHQPGNTKEIDAYFRELANVQAEQFGGKHVLEFDTSFKDKKLFVVHYRRTS